jgi:NAD(P)-dependent dehydrogenase (short-subunit alcohol dehydrogenase family)
MRLNMSKPSEIEAMMRIATENFDGVDMLVNNVDARYAARHLERRREEKPVIRESAVR